MKFYKYQGTGNDFIMIDNRSGNQPKSIDLVKRLCDRRFGIGSDGIIYIEQDDSLDFKMDFYNPDGSQSFCGNGSRCAVAFAKHLGMIGDSCSFRAIDGEHSGQVLKDDLVKVKMRNVSHFEIKNDHFFVDTGSPHYVQEVKDLELDMVAFGRSVRYNDEFKEKGTNVNAIVNNTDAVHMRTYERGVENETLSCGTGVTAVALVALHEGWFENVVSIKTRGGDLQVEASGNSDTGYQNIWLTGPAKRVFEGEVDV